MKFSIIIPVYNVEKYVKECIESILNQSYKDFELILINDGSTDNSKEICKSFNDKRIKFIDSENKGVSNARNLGIEKSSGKYLIFVDSDDILSLNALECINKNLQKDIDLLVFSHIKKYKNSIKHNALKIEKFDKNIALKYLLDDNYYCGYVWNKVFKRNIIVENELKFNINISMNEDLLFCYNYINVIKNNVKSISDELYFYRVRMGSALNSFISPKNVTSIYVYKYILENSSIKEVSDKAKFYYLRSYFKYKKFHDKFDLKLVDEIYQEIYANIPFKEKIKIYVYKTFPQLKIFIINCENIIHKPYK